MTDYIQMIERLKNVPEVNYEVANSNELKYKHQILILTPDDFNIPSLKRTAEFNNWFDGSKVIDKNGAPLVVYHGTTKDFAEFDLEIADGGIHFGSLDQSKEAIHKDMHSEEFIGRLRIIPCYLAIKNPLIMKDAHFWTLETVIEQLKSSGALSQKKYNSEKRALLLREAKRFVQLFIGLASEKTDKKITDQARREETAQMRRLVKELGFDGIIYSNEFEEPLNATWNTLSFMILDPAQCKSVYNEGSFSPNSNDIYH